MLRSWEKIFLPAVRTEIEEEAKTGETRIQDWIDGQTALHIIYTLEAVEDIKMKRGILKAHAERVFATLNLSENDEEVRG